MKTLDTFISGLYEGTLHVDNINCDLKSQTLRMRYLSSQPADRFHTEKSGRFAFAIPLRNFVP